MSRLVTLQLSAWLPAEHVSFAGTGQPAPRQQFGFAFVLWQLQKPGPW